MESNETKKVRIMTPKQKIRSIKKKMERLQKNNHDIDLDYVCRKFGDIERYYRLKQELFFLEFNLNHCEKCGKKL